MIERRRPRYAALILAVMCVILALGCGLGAVAVRLGVIMPPNLSLQVGSMRLAGITSTFPECRRRLNDGCAKLSQVPTTYIYALWLFAPGEQSSGDLPQATQLLAIKIGQ
jgi:hypothetical protein